MKINNSSATAYTTPKAYKLSDANLGIYYLLNQIRPKGKIVYEYNPFRNLRLSSNMDSNGLRPGDIGYNKQDINMLESGTLVDMDTNLLKFDLNHPVDITCQASYDGSVNLVLNDNNGKPKMINSRFSVLENNTYEVVDRIGNNDTNIYDESQFDTDASLYKRINTIPKIEFIGVSPNGNLSVGNYVFYFKLSDLDGNETDFIGESGIVSCYIGNINMPKSIRGGIKDENSNKTVNFIISNIDSSYDYVNVYYTRSTSDVDANRATLAAKITQRFSARNGVSSISITGAEEIVEIPLTDINSSYFIADKVKAQTVCQNMLFLGNISKPDIQHTDLQDLSLRLLPYYTKHQASDLIGNLDYNYSDNSATENRNEYYNTKNIYNNVGYWNEEIYKLAVVYILPDDTLSPAFSIRGINNLPTISNLKVYFKADVLDANGNRIKIPYDDITYELTNSSGTLENAKGVIRINDTSVTPGGFPVYGLNVAIPSDVLNYLKGKVKGFFIVRQKRIPTILCQAFTMGYDKVAQLPLIQYGSKKEYLIESFLDSAGYITNDYQRRLRKVSYNISNEVAICPEYSLNQSYFNTLFTGTEFMTKSPSVQTTGLLARDSFNDRHYYSEGVASGGSSQFETVSITAVADNVIAAVDSDDYTYRARAGEAEEAFKFRLSESKADLDIEKEANRAIRGSFGSYIGIHGSTKSANSLINIYIPGYNVGSIAEYFNTRYEDQSAFYAVSSRLDVEDVINYGELTTVDSKLYGSLQIFRGDCYICTYTHRLNRNFSDPDAPTNDEIVDTKSFKENYKKGDSESNGKINRGDINAVQLGSWITFKLYSNMNLSMRDIDKSYPAEEGLYGQPRTFFPLSDISVLGNSKLPESSIINTGFNNSTSSRYNFSMPYVPYIKNTFQTRILYSDIAINDSFKNGFRVFRPNHYRDYARTYGGIVKLVELFGSVLCVFEHGVALIPVNERAVAGEGAGGNVFINTSNVLPENPKMLSDMYGSQWAESIIKTPYYVYGVDTVGKKIWRTNGSQFEIISDFKMQKFLNDNITLTERELTPIIGVRNVKTHYNAFKQDIMFTFYDNLYGFEEKVWNLCYNEVMQKFITFYSWLPSYSANIDNIFFSFNRESSKWISKLGNSKLGSSNADGIVLSTNVFTSGILSAQLSLVNRPLPNSEGTGLPAIDYVYTLERDNFGNYKKFNIVGDRLQFTGTYDELVAKTVWLLNIKVDVSIRDYTGTDTSIQQYVKGWKEYTTSNYGYYQSVIAITSDKAVASKQLTTDFWKHGQTGIIDIADKIKPCMWYGKQHPFEYEFIVVDNPSVHKIFNNLKIISNKARPESFHYEVVGEAYDFHGDKKNMYIRQEATKDFYQFNGSDILYNRDFLDLRGQQTPINTNGVVTNKMAKSTMFPLYYARVDTFDDVEDYYKQKTSPNKDYANLSGTEIVHEKNLNEFRVWTHAKAVDIKDPKAGRMRGNMNYQEDVWDIQINPIIFVQKNEAIWNQIKTSSGIINKVPISVGNSPTPDDLIGFNISESTPVQDYMPADLRALGYNLSDIDVSDWWKGRKETRLRDKYIKIKVRYTGDELAIITALKTLFTISYA